MDLISLYLKIATDIQVTKQLKIMKCWHVGKFPKEKELDTPFQYEKGTCFIKAEGDKVLVNLYDSTISSTQSVWNNCAQPLLLTLFFCYSIPGYRFFKESCRKRPG